MNKLLTLFAFTLVTFTVNAQSCPDDNHPHAIDLGLPSGTKWACCNVGADTPEAYGGYYAWGETEEKLNYYWSTYTHCDGSYKTCHDLGNDIAGTQYDVAHVKWGDSWVMPSNEQHKELINNSNYVWTKANGINGGKFTSKTNGVSIFLPASGFRSDSDLNDIRSSGRYWSSTQSPYHTYSAYNIGFIIGNARYAYDENRSFGFCVRPVISTTNNIILSESSSNAFSQPIYNLYGIKVADHAADMNTLPPGIYIVNGKKMVIK